MIGIVQAGRNFVYEHRQAILSYGIVMPLDKLYSETIHGRETSTLADLSLHGRLRDVNFVKWLTSINDPETVKQAQESPKYVLLTIQALSDLGRKLILPTIVIAMSYLSPENGTLIDALRNLLSHSAKASKVALPIFNQITEHPRLASLLNLKVIVCAPIVAKLVHMALIYLNAGPPHRYEALKNFVGHFTRGLEVFSNSTFTLYNLGLSTTFYATIANTIYSLTVERLSLFHNGYELLQFFPGVIFQQEIFKNPDNSGIGYLIHLVCYYDASVTNGFWFGVHA
ncbi:MAG: hypothetical protein ACRDFB_07360, partial [Rhabdochlamydiaceae bacterium]